MKNKIIKRVFFIILIFVLLFIFFVYMFNTYKKTYESDEIQLSGGSGQEKEYFAKVSNTDLMLAFPALKENIEGIGFHEADNKMAIGLLPIKETFKDNPEEIKEKYKKNIKPIFFLMNTRNRKQIPTSASDIALKENTPVLSPVTGIISKVIDYKLYKKYDDIKIEIIPDQNKDFKVKIIHLKNVVVKKGEKVKVGDSLGRVRTLSDKMNIQIGRYLPIKIEHIHIQVEKRGV